MPAYHRWVFECDAPRDEFARFMKQSLADQGVVLRRAKVFDFAAEGWGARAFVKLDHDPEGIAAVVKRKATVFGAASALEEAILNAGRDAQARFFVERKA